MAIATVDPVMGVRVFDNGACVTQITDPAEMVQLARNALDFDVISFVVEGEKHCVQASPILARNILSAAIEMTT